MEGRNMRYLIVLAVLALIGCAQAQHDLPSSSISSTE